MILPPEVEANVEWYTKLKGISREEFVIEAIKEMLRRELPFEPRNDWERKLASIPRRTGVVLTDEDLSSEGIYDSY